MALVATVAVMASATLAHSVLAGGNDFKVGPLKITVKGTVADASGQYLGEPEIIEEPTVQEVTAEETTETAVEVIEEPTVDADDEGSSDNDTINIVPAPEVVTEAPTETTTVQVDYYTPHLDVNSSIFCTSGLSAEQLDSLLAGTGLAGLGQAFHDCEENYGVNAFWAIGVAGQESGYGKSSMARNSNNLFGMLGMSFNSKYDCVDYFGRLMLKYQSWGITMSPIGINPTYCTSGMDWCYACTQIANNFIDKANSKF